MEARFLEKVEKTETCWLWTASTKRGYGNFKIDGKQKIAHRVAYTLWIGEIPDGLLVRHKCNNPHCVNPDHLEIGTRQDIANDMVRAGRQAIQKGEQHKLTREQVDEIRSRVGQTQQKLAEEFGVSNQQISRILNHKRW